MTEINNTNDAVRVLWRNFDIADGASQASADARGTPEAEDAATLQQMALEHADGKISEDDLIAIRDDPGFSDEMRAAAEYLLEHRDTLEQIDGGSVDGDVGNIYRDDVVRFIDAGRATLSYDVVAAADAAALLDIGGSEGQWSNGNRQVAFAERMAALPPADRALLMQEILRQDPDAMEHWLQLPLFSAIGPDGNGRISQAGYAAVLDAMRTTPAGLEQIIAIDVRSDVDAYLEHAEGLNWRISRFGDTMDAEALQAAIDEYVGTLGAQWSQDYARLRQQVVEHGAQLLRDLGALDLQSMSEAERDALLASIVDPDNPQAQIAIVMALTEPGAVDTATLEAAMAFFASAGIADISPALAQALAQTRLQHAVEGLMQGDVDAARAALEELRASPYADVLGMDAGQFEAAIDQLLATLVPGADIQQILENDFQAAVNALDAGATGPVRPSEGLRALAVGVASIGVEANPDLARQEPFGDLLTTAETIAGWADVSSSTLDMVLQAMSHTPASGSLLGSLSGRPLGKLLGGVGLVFGVPDLVQSLNDGDWAQASLAAAGVGSGMLAFAPAAWAWAGPAGWALGAVALFGTLALEQWRRIDASNEYMDDASQEFLEHAGFAPDVADALTDQSGEGHSPVPFLFAYGASLGLDREQTIAWLNGLDSGDLESIRDRAHEALDEVNGDLSQLGGTPDQDTLDFLADYSEAAGRGDVAISHADTFTTRDATRVIVAGSWAEFTAVLQAKGLVPPASALPNNGAPMDLLTATELTLDHFDAISSDGDSIDTDDLVRTRDDPAADPQLRLAAEFLLLSRVSRHFLDVGAGRGSVDDRIGREDLVGALDTIRSGAYLDALVDTATGDGGRDGYADADDIAAAWVDPGLSDDQRAELEAIHADNEAQQQEDRRVAAEILENGGFS